MKTIEEIKKEVAKECAEEHFEVIFEAEIEVGDYEQARQLWNQIGDRYIKQFETKDSSREVMANDEMYTEHICENKQHQQALERVYRIKEDLRLIDIRISKESNIAVQNDNLLTAWRKINQLQQLIPGLIENIKNI